MRGFPPSRLALFFVGLGSTLLFLSPRSVGHGGTYRGPGDTAPPLPAAPTGPSIPGDAPHGGVGAGGRSTPRTPGAESGGFRGGGGNGPVAPGPLPGTGTDLGPDLSAWEFWWEFNQDRFLDLRNRPRAAPLVATGSDEFFLTEGRRRAKP